MLVVTFSAAGLKPVATAFNSNRIVVLMVSTIAIFYMGRGYLLVYPSPLSGSFGLEGENRVFVL